MKTLFIIFIAVNIIAMFIGNLVEHIKLPTYLNFKPLNCRLCLSTHSAWVLHTFVAICSNSWIYFIFGIISAICIYYLIKNEENKRWE